MIRPDPPAALGMNRMNRALILRLVVAPMFGPALVCAASGVPFPIRCHPTGLGRRLNPVA